MIDQNINEDSISYIAGGRLGDFINQLSVICEKYHETNKKGILYITEKVGDTFSNGLINTYNETYDIIIKLYYIKDYKIYTNEHYDINLSCWRYNQNAWNHPETCWSIFHRMTYNIEWGKHKWLESSHDDKWSNMVVINVSSHRFPNKNTIDKLYDSIKDDLLNDIL